MHTTPPRTPQHTRLPGRSDVAWRRVLYSLGTHEAHSFQTRISNRCPPKWRVTFGSVHQVNYHHCRWRFNHQIVARYQGGNVLPLVSITTNEEEKILLCCKQHACGVALFDRTLVRRTRDQSSVLRRTLCTSSKRDQRVCPPITYAVQQGRQFLPMAMTTGTCAMYSTTDAGAAHIKQLVLRLKRLALARKTPPLTLAG